ncbi:MAG: MFS transporter, partial [Saezia sp.]
MISSSASMPERAWFPVYALAFAAFIFNTTEFVPVGLLPSIAGSFSMDVANTGLLITGYAWIVTLMSLPLTLLTARWERRRLLLLLVLFIASHIFAAVAWSFASLMVSRVGVACAHAVFWAIATPLVVRMAPMGKGAKALGLMVTGCALATVLGVPIGTIIGQYAGWRMTFLCIGGVALIVLIVLAFLLPRLESSNAGSLKSVPILFKRPALVHIYVLLALLVTAYFTAYTYISPFMSEVGGFGDQFIIILLLVIGCSGIIASIL